MEHRGQAQAQAQAQNHHIMAHASNASQYHLQQQQQQQHSSFRGSVSIDAVRSDKGPSPHPYYDQGQLLSPEQQQRQAMWIGSNMSGGLSSESLEFAAL
ncbi:hypothetical protein BG005_011393 [Podila minutissima]|nr:hypothetical protein BG005_011393 [Podila minutissima]